MTDPTLEPTVPSRTRGPVRVVLVDDHRMFRTGVRAELGTAVDVVGEAEDAEQAVAVITATLPDVVLLDVHLPGGGGRAVLAALVGTLPDVRFLALSVSDAPEDVIAVIRGGARGYVTKSITGPELTLAVRRVADGDAVFSPRLAGFVLDAFAATTEGRRRRRGPRPPVPARARGPAADRARLHVQGGRQGPLHLGENGRDPCLRRAAQAPAVQPARAHSLGQRPPAGLTARTSCRPAQRVLVSSGGRRRSRPSRTG